MTILALSCVLASVVLALALSCVLSQRTKLIEEIEQRGNVIRLIYPMACEYYEQNNSETETEDWRLKKARQLIEADMEEELVQEEE